MNVDELNINQIGVVSGGGSQSFEEEEMKNLLGNCVTRIGLAAYSLSRCLVSVLCGDDCFTRCIPSKKPKECDYSEWGVIHDIEEGVIKKC